MTNKLFWIDPYLAACDTVVESVCDNMVTLRETIFYAESGGQESDAGTIGGRPVLAAHKQGARIDYELAAGHGLRAGDAVRVEIDWPRRYALMRLHFAAELVLELAGRRWPAIEKIGAHIGADKARIDFLAPESLSPFLPALAADAQAMIDADLPIVSAFADAAHERRYWELANFARVPCCGTHLRRSGEVGTLALKRRNVGKGKERIEITAVAPGVG